MQKRKANVIQFAWVTAKNLLFAQCADQTWIAVKCIWPKPREEVCGKPKITRNEWGHPVIEDKKRIVKPEVPEPVVRSCILNVDGCPMLSDARKLVQAMPETYTRSCWDFRFDVRWGKIFPAIPLEWGPDGEPVIRERMYTRCRLFCREIWIKDSGCGASPTDALPLEPRQTRNTSLQLMLPDEQMQFVRSEAGKHGLSPSAEVAAMVRRAVSGS